MRLLLLLLALQSQDPVRVGAQLTDEEIHAGETTILRVDVETDGPRAEIRGFRTLPPGIEVAGTRDYDQRQFSLPGGTRRFITREYVLQARAPGRYRIPSVEVVVEGEVYATRSMLLTVTAAPARPRGETRGAEGGVVLRAWLSSDTVFVGEQVTLEVEAMFSQEARMRLRRAPEYEPPSPSGFWVHDLPDGGRPVSRSVDGEVYEVQRFRRAFFPLSAGDYTIPPAHMEYEMRRGLLYAPETHDVTSDPLALTVLPVPGGQPPAFTGAVGDYDMRARIEPASVPVGEAAVLTVEVEGTGNVKALPAPRLPEVAGVDVFPPSEEASTEAQGSTIRGRKTFSWVLIPRDAGELEIPAIRYAFFDPEAGAFETVEVAPLTLRATPAPAGVDVGSAPATLRFVKTSPTSDPLGWVRSTWFAALQALPLLLLALALLWRRHQRRRDRVSFGGLRRERKRRMRELQDRAEGTDPELFADAAAFARDWLRSRLGLAATAPVTDETLTRAGVTMATAGAVRGVLDRLADARYAPEPPPAATRRTLVAALGRVLETVDREAPRRRASEPGAAATASVLLVLLLAGTAAGQEGGLAAGQERSPAAERPPATELFDGGVTAFQEERYDAAADAFRRYVERVPGDAAGWYNLGTAYDRAGRRGYGVWAWLRALELDPRDGDARHNLRVAGVPPELVDRAVPAVPLRDTELFFLMGLFWLVAGVGGAVWLVRRRRGAAATAIAGLVVAIGLGVTWWASTRGAETLIVLDTATLRAGPALRAEPVATLEPGAGLLPVDRYGDWVRARTLEGEEGWIERNRTGHL